MEDKAIIHLYWDRNDEAIPATEEKDGSQCRLSARILQSWEDAEECVNDTWLRAWNTMPPQFPISLRAYLLKIVRNLSIDRRRAESSRKRGGGATELILELEECLPTAVVWAWVYKCILQDQIQRYNYGNIDYVYGDDCTVKQMFWLEGTTTIPTRASVTVTVSLDKAPSFDCACVGGENQGVNGYDMMTTLDSNLNFTEQTASLEDHGQICIVQQNFGFDLENGSSYVMLKTKEPHYYLEIRRQEGTIPVP